MVILDVVLICLGLAIALPVITQVAIPLATGAPLFPMRSAWRKRHEDKMKNLNDRVDHTLADLEEAEVEDFIAKLREKKEK